MTDCSWLCARDKRDDRNYWKQSKLNVTGKAEDHTLLFFWKHFFGVQRLLFMIVPKTSRNFFTLSLQISPKMSVLEKIPLQSGYFWNKLGRKKEFQEDILNREQSTRIMSNGIHTVEKRSFFNLKISFTIKESLFQNTAQPKFVRCSTMITFCYIIHLFQFISLRLLSHIILHDRKLYSLH